MNNQSSSAPTFVFWIIALVLGFFGFAFVIAAAQGNAMVRLIMGGGCLAGTGSLIYLARMRPVQHTHIHKMEVDLPGKVDVKSYECKSCGATLDSSSVEVVAGAIHVNCPYCGTSYQLEEAPKW